MGGNDDCFVADCRSTRHNSNISFHRIPKKPESRRKLWIKATGRNKFAPTNNSLFCGRHFVNGKRSDDPTSVDFIATMNLPVTLPVTLRQRRATVSSKKSSKYDGAVETLVKENCSVCYTKKRILLPEIDLKNVQNEVQISHERSDEMTECEMLHCQIPCEQGLERMLMYTAIIILSLVSLASSLNNGLALTPPMGWLTWQRYRCTTNCKKYPEDCISESLIKRMTSCLVDNGYASKGYEYVTIDDCWPAMERTKQGRLQPNPDRFPSGIKSLATFVHSKGLKFGIYEDFGKRTCAGYPGSEFYMETDSQTFADWGVDLLKFDGCFSDVHDAPYGYPAMRDYLNKTGRPILYSCEWPLYEWAHKVKTNYSAVQKTCNMWRNYGDITDSWDSVVNIIRHFAKYDKEFRSVAGPGGWNDPDMLVIGNFGLSPDQERAQMAMWAIFAAPLIISADVCKMRQYSKAILQNDRVIAVNQDKLGIQGSMIDNTDMNIQIWSRPVLPHGSFAIVFLNLDVGGPPAYLERTAKDLGLTNQKGYNITETFDNKWLGKYKPDDLIALRVNPTGVFMISAVVLS